MAKRKPDVDIKKLALKLGVAESTLRARKARGLKLDSPKQIRTTPSEQKKIVAAKGTIDEVARQFGVSISTVKRLRRVLGGARKSSKKKK